MRLYGPSGFIDRVEHRLAGYSWNLVQNYPTDFTLLVHELTDEGLRVARFRCHGRFRREPLPARAAPRGLLLDEPAFRVRAAALDHDIPCLGFALEEKVHVNVWKNRLHEMGLEPGPWLSELKRAVAEGAPDDAPIRAHEHVLSLGELKARVLRLVPGQKLCYVTDVVYSADNAGRIAALAADADLLFIECVFLDEDADHAARKFHLTARQAGLLARAARARQVIPFHFSPRYGEREAELRAQLETARAGG